MNALTNIPPEISKGLQALLDRAGMEADELPKTIQDCDDELAFLAVEISEIKGDLALYDEGELMRENGWKAKATYAMRCRQAHFSAIKRYRNTLQMEDRRKAKDTVLENVRNNLEKAIAARDVKIRNIHHSQQRANHALVMLKAWIRENYPERLSEAYAIASAAEADFDHKEQVA